MSVCKTSHTVVLRICKGMEFMSAGLVFSKSSPTRQFNRCVLLLLLLLLLYFLGIKDQQTPQIRKQQDGRSTVDMALSYLP